MALLVLAGGVSFTGGPAALRAQQLPPGVTPAQALELLKQRPELGDVVRRRLKESGLTDEQIRAQLQAQGLSPNALDAYLTADSIPAPFPGAEVLDAVRALGLSLPRRDSLLLAGDTTALRMFRDSIRAATTAGEAKEQALQVFGVDVFRQPTTQFQPIVTGPVDDNYRLGPGDVLALILTGDVELAYTLEVSREGFILIPQVGQVFVGNLTMGRLRDVLYTRLGRVYSGVRRGRNATTRFDVTVTRVRVNTVRVLGEVARPGSYQIAATATVLAAIYDAGGLTERSNFRNVAVRRGSNLVGVVDLYDYLLSGKLPTDIHLESGDVIFVPVRGPRVAVTGEVKRPAIYEVSDGETLRDVIAAAGGFTATAYLENATISRILPPGERRAGRSRTVLTVNLAQLLSDSAVRVPMLDGDSVTVFSVTELRRNAVTIEGSVWQPGTYSLEPGMRLSDLVRAAGGLRPETYAGRAQVVRLRPDSTRYMVGVRLPADTGLPFPTDLELREFDEVRIFASTEFRPERTVSVLGAVRSPGQVRFADSITLRDAILLAGGLTDEAYLVEAEVARRLERPDPNGDTLVTVLKVPLDSTYVADATGFVRRPVGAGTAPDVYLKPYDQVLIRRQPGMEPQRNVIVTGEVLFPGVYPIRTKEDRLLDLLRAAGGLTEQAYPNGIRFIRSQDSIGRINVDLARILREPDFRDNLLLVAGDSIHIPAYIPTVLVEGEVHSPTAVAYVPGKNAKYYVKAAGDFTDRADKGDTFIQQPNGSIQDKGKKVEPGGRVVVPAKDLTKKGVDIAVLLAGLAQALSALTTILLVVNRL